MQKLFVPAKQVNKATDLWQVTATWFLRSHNNVCIEVRQHKENKTNCNSDGERELLGESTRGANHWSDQIVIRDWAWLCITSGSLAMLGKNKQLLLASQKKGKLRVRCKVLAQPRQTRNTFTSCSSLPRSHHWMSFRSPSRPLQISVHVVESRFEEEVYMPQGL